MFDLNVVPFLLEILGHQAPMAVVRFVLATE